MTDQGIGASVWWPGKGTQADEPDSQRVAITVPDPIVNVSNGRLRSTTPHDDTYEGEAGTLSLDFWPLG